MAKTLDPMDLKQIIRLHLDGLSNREIEKTLSIGRNTINGYMQRFKACDFTLKQLLKLEEPALRELFSSKTIINNERYSELMQYFDKVKLARVSYECEGPLQLHTVYGAL
jgi:hypothetical protein